MVLIPEILAAYHAHVASLPPAADIAFVDTETTGLDPSRHELIEIAVIRVDGRTLVEKGRFAAKIKPTGEVPEAARRVNGYTPEKWAGARECCDVLLDAVRMIDGARWAGSNPRFDRDFVEMSAAGAGVCAPVLGSYRLIDVSAMVEPLVVAGLMERSGMDAICEFFGLDTSRRHSAEGDAELALEAYRRILEFFAGPIVERVKGKTNTPIICSYCGARRGDDGMFRRTIQEPRDLSCHR